MDTIGVSATNISRSRHTSLSSTSSVGQLNGELSWQNGWRQAFRSLQLLAEAAKEEKDRGLGLDMRIVAPSP
jgi:hypothetical protein